MSLRLRLLVGSLVACLGAFSAVGVAAAHPATPRGDGFNRRGNVLIADQFNNRVIEVNASHQIIWSFGDGSSVAGPHSIVAPNDAERVGRLTLISGTGAPAGAEPSCPTGCPDNRVVLVNRSGHIVWQYGQAGVTGAGFNQLNAPVAAVVLPNHDILITDQGNQRVIEVTPGHRIVWQYGKTSVTGFTWNRLNNPNSAELLPNGHVLIADESNNRVIDVARDHMVTWSAGSPTSTLMNAPAFASRLPGGGTLISDSGNNRIVLIDHGGNIVWSYVTSNRPGSVAAPTPTRAVMLRNGKVLISDQFNHQVIEITKAGKIVWQQGQVGVAGAGFNQLNAPYDAKVIGDYTGLTPPPED
jgi:predicted secreted protein